MRTKMTLSAKIKWSRIGGNGKGQVPISKIYQHDIEGRWGNAAGFSGGAEDITFLSGQPLSLAKLVTGAYIMEAIAFIKTGRKYRKDSPHFLAMELSFSVAARLYVEEHQLTHLVDQAALDFYRRFAEAEGVEGIYVVRHNNEMAPHYHLLFSAIDSDGRSIRRRINSRRCRRLQDEWAEACQTYGLPFHRGSSRSTSRRRDQQGYDPSELDELIASWQWQLAEKEAELVALKEQVEIYRWYIGAIGVDPDEVLRACKDE